MSAMYFVLEHVAEKISHSKMLGLLYLADLENVITCGFPITEDTPVMGKKGPELEGVRSLLENNEFGSEFVFSHYFATENSEIYCKKPFNYDWLSKNDQAVLATVCERFGQESEYGLVNVIRNLPECVIANGFSWELVLQVTRPNMVPVYEDLSTMLDTSPSYEVLEYELSCRK